MKCLQSRTFVACFVSGLAVLLPTFGSSELVDVAAEFDCRCWAAQGQCAENPDFMSASCSASCSKHQACEESEKIVSDCQSRIAELESGRSSCQCDSVVNEGKDARDACSDEQKALEAAEHANAQAKQAWEAEIADLKMQVKAKQAWEAEIADLRAQLKQQEESAASAGTSNGMNLSSACEQPQPDEHALQVEQQLMAELQQTKEHVVELQAELARVREQAQEQSFPKSEQNTTKPDGWDAWGDLDSWEQLAELCIQFTDYLASSSAQDILNNITAKGLAFFQRLRQWMEDIALVGWGALRERLVQTKLIVAEQAERTFQVVQDVLFTTKKSTSDEVSHTAREDSTSTDQPRQMTARTFARLQDECAALADTAVGPCLAISGFICISIAVVMLFNGAEDDNCDDTLGSPSSKVTGCRSGAYVACLLILGAITLAVGDAAQATAWLETKIVLLRDLGRSVMMAIRTEVAAACATQVELYLEKIVHPASVAWGAALQVCADPAGKIVVFCVLTFTIIRITKQLRCLTRLVQIAGLSWLIIGVVLGHTYFYVVADRLHMQASQQLRFLQQSADTAWFSDPSLQLRTVLDSVSVEPCAVARRLQMHASQHISHFQQSAITAWSGDPLLQLRTLLDSVLAGPTMAQLLAMVDDLRNDRVRSAAVLALAVSVAALCSVLALCGAFSFYMIKRLWRARRAHSFDASLSQQEATEPRGAVASVNASHETMGVRTTEHTSQQVAKNPRRRMVRVVWVILVIVSFMVVYQVCSEAKWLLGRDVCSETFQQAHLRAAESGKNFLHAVKTLRRHADFRIRQAATAAGIDPAMARIRLLCETIRSTAMGSSSDVSFIAIAAYADPTCMFVLVGLIIFACILCIRWLRRSAQRSQDLRTTSLKFADDSFQDVDAQIDTLELPSARQQFFIGDTEDAVQFFIGEPDESQSLRPREISASPSVPSQLVGTEQDIMKTQQSLQSCVDSTGLRQIPAQVHATDGTGGTAVTRDEHSALELAMPSKSNTPADADIAAGGGLQPSMADLVKAAAGLDEEAEAVSKKVDFGTPEYAPTPPEEKVEVDEEQDSSFTLTAADVAACGAVQATLTDLVKASAKKLEAKENPEQVPEEHSLSETHKAPEPLDTLV